ncbi:hypothetical protein [Treponema sp.]|uniref:hypothetical protein n=1 Tax=Treponema sp. TaxID=166 RepID=UPI0025F12C39|nr:hypothetical protein [Treponema sp.]MCR5219194.1 hypothetical protein [Treponema sp.]
MNKVILIILTIFFVSCTNDIKSYEPKVETNSAVVNNLQISQQAYDYVSFVQTEKIENIFTDYTAECTLASENSYFVINIDNVENKKYDFLDLNFFFQIVEGEAYFSVYYIDDEDEKTYIQNGIWLEGTSRKVEGITFENSFKTIVLKLVPVSSKYNPHLKIQFYSNN